MDDDCLEDPLVPARARFPMVAPKVDRSEALPTPGRPFVLRGAVVVTPGEAHHRTPSHQTRIPQTTHRDNAVDDDSYTVPDD